jgi:hypothetical protein
LSESNSPSPAERQKANSYQFPQLIARCGLRNEWWKLVAFGLLMVALAVIGYWRMFTQFMAYDDEGCLLWSLSNYCSEGGLYDRVESWYGPFFFTCNHLLHALAGLNFNTTRVGCSRFFTGVQRSWSAVW